MTDKINERMARNFSAVVDGLENESDRGSVIIAGAWIDDLLLESLKKRLLPSAAKRDELFSTHGPIGTFSAKIDVAYRVSLITDEVRRSLHIYRRLRNDFAHISNPISFETQEVNDRVLEIFRLNKHMHDTIWISVKGRLPMEVKEGIDDSDPGKALLQALKTRTLFDITAGITISGLTMVAEQTERVEKLTQGD